MTLRCNPDGEPLTRNCCQFKPDIMHSFVTCSPTWSKLIQVGFTIWASFPDILETLLAQGPLEIKEKRLIQGKSIKGYFRKSIQLPDQFSNWRCYCYCTENIPLTSAMKLRWPFAWPEENHLKSYWIWIQVPGGSPREFGSNQEGGRARGDCTKSSTTCRLIVPYIDVKMQKSIQSVTQIPKLN